MFRHGKLASSLLRMLSTRLRNPAGARFWIYLAGAERPVGEIVAALGVPQPSISKHLRVLHDVGLVRMRCQGRQKLYQTNPEAIRPLHEWAGTFERYWQHQLNRVKERAEAMAGPGSTDLKSPSPNPEPEC